MIANATKIKNGFENYSYYNLKSHEHLQKLNMQQKVSPVKTIRNRNTGQNKTIYKNI